MGIRDNFTSILSRLGETICPLIPYWILRKRKLRLVINEEILEEDECSQFTKVTLKDLRMRLSEESERASVIHEKTYKMALSLSIALAITGYALTVLSEHIPYSAAKICFSVLITLGVVHFLLAGIVALGAIRTEPSYGSTTQILLLGKNKQQQCLAKCLAQSEEMNIIRHFRNEAVYLVLRNGHILFLLATMLFICSRVYEFFVSIF